MPTVPKDDRVVPFRPQPSETDLMMALATMKDLGRIPLVERLDPSLQGQIEDRREQYSGEAQDARDMAANRLLLATKRYRKPTVMDEFEEMKKRREMEGRNLLSPSSRDSLGVLGGSR